MIADVCNRPVTWWWWWWVIMTMQFSFLVCLHLYLSGSWSNNVSFYRCLFGGNWIQSYLENGFSLVLKIAHYGKTLVRVFCVRHNTVKRIVAAAQRMCLILGNCYDCVCTAMLLGDRERPPFFFFFQNQVSLGSKTFNPKWQFLMPVKNNQNC